LTLKLQKIGIIRDDIEKLFEEKIISNREKAYLLTSLMYAFDKIANTVGHYDAYRKVDIPEKRLFLLPLAIRNSKYNSEIYRDDANDLVKKINADVVYIDPPYNSRQYCDSYHLLENVAVWKKEKVYGIARKIDRSHLKSQYNMKTASVAFCDLINNINAKYILLSYNDMGTSGNVRSQSRISDYEILSVLKIKGEVKIFEMDFKQFTTGKSNKDDLKERIFLCKVNMGSKTKRMVVVSSKHNPVRTNFVKSPLNYTGGKHKLLPQITKIFPVKIDTFYDVFSGGANVGINAVANKIVCIEKNTHVVNLLKFIQKSNFKNIHQKVIDIVDKFGLSQSYIKGYDFYKVNSSDGLGQFNKEAFLRVRDEFNKNKTRMDLLLTLILYSFNNQIRFNSNSDFNLPVGKRDYNGNSRKNIAAFNQLANEKKIVFKNCDFREILGSGITQNDFVYLDPPYLLGLASYNELDGWNKNYEIELYSVLSKLNKRNVRFALSNVLEHKGVNNEIMKKWANSESLKINKLNYDYKNSNYHSTARNNNTVEVLITNY
jgi:adenine-specific DNA-methyltransferase